ncbi:MAG: DNA mismatch repair endonuclease MutL [Deltaproteobacteria bacterium]|nr:DNA mismatch repair endonuclease MutL [Deltaproteobacteria bacterium]
MSKIQILPEILSNKIAAGEVVERPASVVKELLENALDAGSKKIIVEIEQGGKSLIRVSDNGSGMNYDDALLSIERYATSKIFSDSDLFAIKTLGFRGEALPSIASVSRFQLVTRDENSQTGTTVFIDGGKITKVTETGAPTGTMITIRQLFYNTPARRKFLKTINTEMSHVADTVVRIAMSRHDVAFKLLHNNKQLKNWPVVQNPLDRAVDVLGSNIKNDLHKIVDNGVDSILTGWISSPGIARSTARGIYLFVNGRFVRDRMVQHALFKGYAGRLMKGQFPVAVLFLKIPFDQVDINVHPAKAEVKFVEQTKIHDAIVKSVAQTLNIADRPKWTEATPCPVKNSHVSGIEPEYGYIKKKKYSPSKIFIDKENFSPINRKDESLSIPQKAEQSPLWAKSSFRDLRIIGQLHNTYILCESDEGLVILDQHAAHERIIFEKLKARTKGLPIESQKLLIPETIDLSYREAAILAKILPELQTFGLEIEPFGGNTFVVKAVPSLLADREVQPLIIEIVEKLAETGFASGISDAVDKCLIIMACHGSIRAKQRLLDKQIQAILDQLDGCENPSCCPHGRPIWLNWSIKTFEKSFKRVL